MRLGPRTLDFYVGGRCAAIYGASFASFSLIYVLVDSVAQIGALSGATESFLELLAAWFRFYAAQLPILFCRVLGAVTAVASAAFTVTLLQRANEIAPVLAAGISLRRLLAPVLAMATLSAAASLAVQELWIPANREEIREAKAPGKGRAIAFHPTFFDAKNRVLVVLRRYNLRTFHGEGVLVHSLSPGDGPSSGEGKQFTIEARSVQWVEETKSWMLEDGFIQEYDASGALIPVAPQPGASGPPASLPGAPERDPAAGKLIRSFERQALTDLVAVDMLPSDIEDRDVQESFLWFSEVWEKLRRSPDSFRWRIKLYGRLADPLHGLILVLLGLPLILGRGSRNVFLSAIATVVLCALYFMAYTMFIHLGNREALPPSLACGLAPLIFGSLGATMFVGMRT